MISWSEAMFTTCVAVVILVPRTPKSSGFIGGDLTAPFRKAVFCIVLMNVFRSVCFDDRRFRESIPADQAKSSTEELATLAYYTLTSIESIFTAFLKLLMPYLLQCQLSEVININPGRNLKPWLIAILLMNVTGIFGALYHPNLWAIKRLGDALGTVPVIKTLQLFRRVNTTRGGNTITIRSVEVLEWYSLCITVAAAIGYLLDDHQSSLSMAVRVSSIFVSWARLMFHGLLLNVMDEAIEIATNAPSQPTAPDRNESPVDLADAAIESGRLLVRSR